MKEISIQAHCCSEKEDVGIGFGWDYESDNDSLYTKDTEWIYVGMSESFWENAFEFDAGIEKASKLMESNGTLTYKEALFAVFGNFSITYEVDGKEISDSWNIDANEAMYELLQEL